MMRDGYQRLCEIVPALRESTASASRKEAVILQKTVEYLRTLLIERYELGCEIEKLNGELGRPDDVIDSVG